MKKSVIIFLFQFYILGFANQNTEIDSLQLLLPTATNQDEIEIYYQLADLYYSTNKDSAFYYIQRGFGIAKTINDKGLIAQGFAISGAKYIGDGKLDTALYLTNQAIEISQNNMASVDYRAYSSLGTIDFYNGNNNSAIENYLKSVEASKSLKNVKGLSRSYYNLGLLFGQMQSWPQSIEYLKKANDEAERNKEFTTQGIILVLLGEVFVEIDQLDSAEFYIKKAAKLSEIGNSSDLKYRIYDGLGSLYEEREEYDSAFVYAKKSYDIVKDTKSEHERAITICALARIEALRKEYISAEKYFMELEKLNENNDFAYAAMNCQFYRAEMEQERGNYKLAYSLFREYMVGYDSTYQNEKDQMVLELETKYKTALKDAQIQEQELTLQNKTAQIKKKNALTLALGSLALLIAGLLGASYYSNRQRIKLKEERINSIQKEKEMSSIKAMLEGEEKERGRIARELHDGLGGTIASIKMKLSQLSSKHVSLEESDDYNELLLGIENTGEEVRRISHNLMPEVLLKFGLIKALEEHLTNIDSAGLLKVDFQHYQMEKRLTKRVELSIYRIIQELINNIIKHANASQVLVQLNRNVNTLTITIEDDGKGLNWESSSNNKGIGLSNLKSRLNVLQGELNVESDPKMGTSVYIQVELEKQNDIKRN